MHHQRGFTLIELSIVLVIIGLLIGVVLGAKSMFGNAEARTVMSEADIYANAFTQFTNRYMAIPGDMKDATSVWPADSNCPTTAFNTTPKINTCNGDGNGTIGSWTNETFSSTYEWFRAWQHLSNSGLITGLYTGVPDTGGGTSSKATLAVNIPKSKTGKAGWGLLYMVSTTSNNYFFSAAPVASHVLLYGAQTATTINEEGILTPVDASNIDTKMDDGMPHTGKIRSKKSVTACATAASVAGNYVLTSTEQTCQLFFQLGV